MPITQLTDYLWYTRSRVFHTNSGVFISQGQGLLIDPGVLPQEIAIITEFVIAQGIEPRALVITHAHWDHFLGVEAFPDVKIITHTDYRKVLRERADALRQQVARFDAQAPIKRAIPFTLPLPHLTFETELHLTIGDATLHLLHAPGHAPDQLVIHHPESGLLWAADMLSDLEIPMISHNLAAYESTLAQLAQRDIHALMPGHGHPTTATAEITARVAADRAYLAELRQRVTEALTNGKSIEETVAACADMRFRQPAEENAGPHRLNVESVYLELGGAADATKVGWEQEWGEP